MNRRLSLFISISVLGLSACGGGGGGGGSTSVLPNGQSASFPIQTAFKNFYASPHSYNLAGINNSGQSVTGSLSYMPGPTATQNGVSGSTVVETYNFTNHSTGYVDQGSNTQYSGQPYGPIFNVNTSTTPQSVTSGGTLPDNATVGQTGPYYSAKVYTDSSQKTLAATETATYEVRQGTSSPGTAALICLDYSTTASSSNGSVTIGENDCFATDVAGNLSAPQISINITGTGSSLGVATGGSVTLK